VTGDQIEMMPSFIIWGEDIFASFQAGYLKPLDYDLCMGLKNSTAKRMYRFLDKKFYLNPRWTFELREFAHEHIGLGRHYEGPAHLKRNLQPAIDELEKVGFLEPLSEPERFPKRGREWKVTFAKKEAAQPAAPTASLLVVKETPPLLVTELVQRGVTEATAAELVKCHLAETIQVKLEVFDWLKERKDNKVDKSTAGYLVKSISDAYAVPEGFTPKAEREKKETAQKAKFRELDEDKRRKRAEEDREREDRKAVDAYLSGLTPKQRAELEKTVLEQETPEKRESYDSPVMKRYRDTLMLCMLREYLAPRLREKQTPVEA
jgi:hypothetical protein